MALQLRAVDEAETFDDVADQRVPGGHNNQRVSGVHNTWQSRSTWQFDLTIMFHI